MSTTSFPEIRAPLRALTDEEFGNRALRLFAFQFLNNGAYRRLCVSKGIEPGVVQDWKEIPAVPTAAFKEFDVTCLAPSERIAVFHSSGTTEQRPSRHFHSVESLAIYEESLLIGFRENVFKKSDVMVLSLTPTSDEAPRSSLVHMFETVCGSRRREEAEPQASQRTPPPHVGGYGIFLGLVNQNGDWLLDHEQAVGRLGQISDQSQPCCILGTAFLFVHLLDEMRKRELRFKLPDGSVIMETGGYKGRSRSIPRSELHGMMQDGFGVKIEQIVCEYGMSELSSQAYSRVSGVFSFPGWCRVQIVSPETGREVGEGETGLIRVFDLANVYSVMAVQTDDLGIKRGNGFELVGRAAMSEARGCSLMVSSE